MNKDEVLKLANELGSTENLSEEEIGKILAFANACEKIGMEKAAKICRDASWIDGNAHLYADAILAHKE